MKSSGSVLLVLVVFLCLFGSPASAFSAQEDFSAWLADFRREAEKQGVSRQTLETTLDDLRPLPKVLDFQSRQPELKLTYEDYRDRMISLERINTAQRKMRQYSDVLEDVSSRYGVAPSILAALWAVESDFGRRAGTYPVLRSLATLAHQGRRQPFFRRELLEVLAIVDKGWAEPSELVGSWAGAMGVFQFIPSTMRHYAVDHNGDGRRDIFNNGADAFASAANYLDKARWRDDESWGMPVEVPKGFAAKAGGAGTWRKPASWQKLGFEEAGGLSCSEADLVVTGDGGEQAFLVCRNFETLMRWNKSTWFALTVGQLADRIEEAGSQEWK